MKKLVAAFSVRPGTPTASEEQIAAGTMEVELVPQGITMVSNYLEGRDVILHAENGVLGYGRMVSEEHEIDPTSPTLPGSSWR